MTSIIKEVPDASPLTHQIDLLPNPVAHGLNIGHLWHVHPLTLLHLNQCLNPSKHEWLVSQTKVKRDQKNVLFQSSIEVAIYLDVIK